MTYNKGPRPRGPRGAVESEICYALSQRQRAVRAAAMMRHDDFIRTTSVPVQDHPARGVALRPILASRLWKPGHCQGQRP